METSEASHQIIADLLAARTGQHLTESRRWRVNSALAGIFREHGISNVDQLVCLLASPRTGPESPDLSQDVVEALLNNETYFFRDKPTFDQLPQEIIPELARRRLGYGRGARMKFEQDDVIMLAGVRHGSTLGGPIAIEIGNSEWPKWETVMAADPVDAAELESEGGARNAPLTRPRPGHADYAGMLKYGFDDARPVLERASARETAARVAAGPTAGRRDPLPDLREVVAAAGPGLGQRIGPGHWISSRRATSPDRLIRPTRNSAETLQPRSVRLRGASSAR
jgi:hypothetical protein